MKKRKIFTYCFISSVLFILFLSSFMVFYSLRSTESKLSLKTSVVNSSGTVPVATVKKNVLLDKELSIPSEESKPVVKDAEPPETVEIVISSVGDVTLGTDENFYKPASLPAVLLNNGNDYSYFFRNVAEIFENDDITTANLETTFTTSNKKRAGRTFNFKGDPSLAKSLTLGSIEGVNLSNNHIYDYEQQGFNDTIKALKENNINYFGEGHRWITTVKGVKFAFLGYMGWSNDRAFLNSMKKDIQELKAQDCIVIINVHWGDEGKYHPNSVQRSIGHFAIDNGADLVIGHHPHVIQGIEKYKDRYICYSLANFCFGGNSNPKDKDTFIFQAKFKFTNKKFDSLGIKVIPCSVSSVSYRNDYMPTPLKGADKSRVMKKINDLSINLGFLLNEDFQYIQIK
jgi:poly-gamma-glutamate capsule biosynthesis protein CapA/YwtB (metallophosphatase superfamily)